MLKKLSEALGLPRSLLLGSILLLTVWTAAIIATGAQINLFPVEWNFANSGAFGDSFGPLSAMMALVAALSAIAAYKAQAKEISRLQARQEIEDAERDAEKRRFEKRQADIDRAAQKASFEGTFFKLLETFRSIVAQIDIRTTTGQTKSGHDAFSAILNYATRSAQTRNGELGKAWQDTAFNYRNDLNHYFRFLYHMVMFVDKYGNKDRKFYTRFIRALLSESELIILGLNCAYGEGRDKFLPLVEKYALLHNMADSSRERWFANSVIKAGAFETQRPSKLKPADQ